MPDTGTKLAAGDRVGEYEILARVGAGGMGVGYRALDLKLQRTIALKFLPEELVANDAQKQQFLREARTASALEHPNTGVIHGIEETANVTQYGIDPNTGQQGNVCIITLTSSKIAWSTSPAAGQNTIKVGNG